MAPAPGGVFRSEGGGSGGFRSGVNSIDLRGVNEICDCKVVLQSAASTFVHSFIASDSLAAKCADAEH